MDEFPGERPPSHRANPADVPHSSVTWMVSPHDGELHAFRSLGEPAEAVCTHSAPAAQLTVDDEERPVPRCWGCLMIHGDELTRQRRIADQDW